VTFDNLSRVIELAFQQDRAITLIPADDYGIHVAVEGVPLTRMDDHPAGDEGMAWETFDYDLGDGRASEEAAEKIAELQDAFLEDRIDTSGDIPRIAGTEAPVPQLAQMRGEGMLPYEIAEWFPDVSSTDVRAAVLYMKRSERSDGGDEQ